MANESPTNGATTLSRMSFSGYVGHVTIFSSPMRAVSSSVRVRVSIRFRFSVWLVSGPSSVLNTSTTLIKIHD